MTSTDNSESKKKRREVDPFTRGRIIGQSDEGASTRKISSSLGVAQTTVGRIIRQFREKGITAPAKRSGRPVAMSERTKLAIARSLRQKTSSESITAQHRRMKEAGINMSLATFQSNITALKNKGKLNSSTKKTN